MTPFILFCKSYRDDVLRVKKLLDSVVSFNEDKIPFYLCVPSKDLSLFKKYIDFKHLQESYLGQIQIITDEEVVGSMEQPRLDIYNKTNGYISQQVIKSQVWRLIGCEAYLSLDSDSYFTKPFHLKNFLNSSNLPYTILHDGKELLELSQKLGYPKVKEFFIQDSQSLKMEFHREGVDYDFGPAPLIWSAKVWQMLESHLKDTSESIWEAFTRKPSEIRWYGETLLKYKPIAIDSIPPLFNCFHYEWQVAYYDQNQQLLDSSNQYIGKVIQSYWDETLRPRFAQKSFVSRFWKKIKTKLH
jgi:hypothetical protein